MLDQRLDLGGTEKIPREAIVGVVRARLLWKEVDMAKQERAPREQRMGKLHFPPARICHHSAGLRALKHPCRALATEPFLSITPVSRPWAAFPT